MSCLYSTDLVEIEINLNDEKKKYSKKRRKTERKSKKWDTITLQSSAQFHLSKDNII